MEQKKYGYVRVSTKEQNEDRQVQAMLEYGIPQERIFIDKQSGKDFNRAEYQTLKRMLKDSPNSLLVIHSIDRLGRNYKEITKEWRELTTECKADIKVLDMPLLDTTQYKDLLGTFISDLILQVLSFLNKFQYQKKLHFQFFPLPQQYLPYVNPSVSEHFFYDNGRLLYFLLFLKQRKTK